MGQPRQHGQWWVGALVAGVIGGLGDGLAATRHLLLAPDGTRDLALVVVSVVVGSLVALIAGMLLPLGARMLGRDWPPGRWTGFVCGAAAWAAVCVAAILPGWWAAAGLLVLGVAPLVVHRDTGRPRMVVALGFLALLAVRVADDRRPRDREAAPTSPGPDVVIVVVDGLRGDQVDRLPRGDLPAMPNLTELAATGTRFTQVTTPTSTGAGAQQAAIAGLAPWTSVPEHGWARELRGLGWRSGIFGGPEVRGVAHEAGFMVQDVDPGWLAGASAGAPGNLWLRLADVRGARRSGRRVVDAWSRWLDDLPAQRPAVSVLHFTDLVWPTRPTPPWDTAFQRPPAELGSDASAVGACATEAEREGLRTRADVRTAYDGAAAAVDALMPEVFARASARPRGAMVFVMGSRGTPMGESGRWLASTGGTHPAELTVPLVVVGTDVPEGSTLGAPVSTVDVVATVRARTGLAAVEGARPIPGLVRGYPPRAVALSVGADGAVVATSADALWRRTADGQVTRFEEGQWTPQDAGPDSPVPVLPPVAADPAVCGG